MSDVSTYMAFLTGLDEKPIRLRNGETLFKSGDRSDGRLFVVRTGSVGLFSGRRLLERVGPGGILGEMALIDPAPRSATAVAGADCTLSAVSDLTFRKLVTHVPGFALEMMRLLVQRFRQATRPARKRRKVVAPRRPVAKKK
jgi:CRP/FNR family transcriptional regulator, cyclic AMP receptor protein